MKIRAIGRGDLDATAVMMIEFDRHLAAIEGKRSRLKLAQVRSDLARAGFGRRVLIKGLIAEQGKEPCGYLLYHIGFNTNVRRGSLTVSDLYVRARWRRKKVGEALMLRARDIARKRGCAYMEWTVWDMNPAAIAFYLGLGARPVDDEILMGWKIGR
jgi:ribosomal protein S18 acetylase RimI-like enzyme